MKILSVVSARPNFMKIAPFIRAIDAHNATIPNPASRIIMADPVRHRR